MTVQRGRQAWKWLASIFAGFWLLFAFVLIVAGIPFYVVGMALTTIALLSLLIVALAWAFTHDY